LKTKNSYSEKAQFVILIPHRDALNHLAAYRERLFSIGFHGAYSFPPAAVLARVSGPFSREELKELAGNIRGLSKENDGKISCGTVSTVHHDSEFSFFGPLLKLHSDEGIFPTSARVKIIKSFSPPILCAALVEPGSNPVEEKPAEENPLFEEAPALSFRAAALANLVIRPMSSGEMNYSFRWKISPLVWLPAHKQGIGSREQGAGNRE